MGLNVTCGLRLVVSLALGLAAIGGGLAPVAAEAASPTLDFETQRVVLRGLTPSGNVAWYSVSREPQGYSTLIVQRSGSLTADALGVAAIELEQDIALASVWVVVDLDGGGFAVGGPPVTSFRDVGIEAWSVAAGDSAALDHLVHARPYLELFWARPGVGAWVMAAGDGAAGDEDGAQDGFLRTSFAAMEPIEASPPPSDELQANDVLVVVDPRALEYYAVAFQP